MTKRREPLTLRKLRGMQAALSIAAAGAEDDLCGNDGPEARYLHAAAIEAHHWVNAEIERREAKTGRKPPTHYQQSAHIGHPNTNGQTMCGLALDGLDNVVRWEPERATMEAAATCKSCLRAHRVERQREDERAAKADHDYRKQHGDSDG